MPGKIKYLRTYKPFQTTAALYSWSGHTPPPKPADGLSSAPQYSPLSPPAPSEASFPCFPHTYPFPRKATEKNGKQMFFHTSSGP